MAVDYEFLAELVRTTILENGRTVTLRRRARAPGDPLKPWRGPSEQWEEEEVDPDVPAVFVNEEFSDPANTLIRRKFDGFIVSAKQLEGLVLEEFDAVIDRGEIWKINKVVLYEPGDVPLLYELHAKQ